MIKINNIQLVDGMRISTQEETSTQLEDLRILADKATQYANELDAMKRNMQYQTDVDYTEKIEKARSYFLAAIQFALAYENTDNNT